MTVVVGAEVRRVRRDHPAGPVVVELAGCGRLVGDELLVAAGRRVAVDKLGLDTVGRAPGRVVDVDDAMRVMSVDGEWLYAVGDCNGRAQLTHMGKYQARIAADAILGRDAHDIASADVVPRVTFIDPQVCAVGLTEAEVRARGLDVRAATFGTGDVPGAYTLGNGINGTSKLVIDAARGVVIGATFTGPVVQELLHSATVAIVGEVPLERLVHAVPAFPTISEVWVHLLEGYGL